MTEEAPTPNEEAPETPTEVESEENQAKPQTGTGSNAALSSVLEIAKKVITNPVGFFKEMPKTGGLGDPLVFAVAIGLVSGVLTVILALFKLSSFVSIIVMPVLAIIGSFIGGAIMFVIWKLMGSEEDFETAYRCCAYLFAIHPVTMILGLIPYLGTIVGMAWGLYLVVLASTEVHKIKAKTAWIVFGVLTAIGLLANLRAERFSRNVEKNMPEFTKEGAALSEDMTPEEAGRAFGEFMRGMQEAAEKAESGGE